MATRAPCCASRSAIPRPIRLAAPVTRITRPAREDMSSIMKARSRDRGAKVSPVSLKLFWLIVWDLFPGRRVAGLAVRLLVAAAILGRRRDIGGYTGGSHDFAKRGFRLRGGFEITEPVTLGDQQRGPSLLVPLVPHLDVGALLGKQQHSGTKVTIGCP